MEEIVQQQQPPAQIMQSVKNKPNARILPRHENRNKPCDKMGQLAVGLRDVFNGKRNHMQIQSENVPSCYKFFKQIPEIGTDTDYDIAKQKLTLTLRRIDDMKFIVFDKQLRNITRP